MITIPPLRTQKFSRIILDRVQNFHVHIAPPLLLLALGVDEICADVLICVKAQEFGSKGATNQHATPIFGVMVTAYISQGVVFERQQIAAVFDGVLHFHSPDGSVF